MKVRLFRHIFVALLFLAGQARGNGVWDGIYVGKMDNVAERSSGRACGGGRIKRIRVHNNVFIFPYNESEGVSIPAKIDANGVVTGETNSARAGARIEARIATGIMSGTVYGQWCTYTIKLSRQSTN
ncbi:MAG TPA: hypothetical protein VME45_07940 [Stellaceae bacterium]|nr:hypothetical protein [Stellaceae bacterium]